MRKFLSFATAAMIAMAFSVGAFAVMAQDAEATPEAEATAEADTSVDSTADTTDTVAVRAWIGARVSDTENGVTIVRVRPESPAATAELAEGDVITAFNGTEITTSAELVELVTAAAPEDVVTLTVLRDGEEISIEVTLGSAPARGGFRGGNADGSTDGMPGGRGGRGGFGGGHGGRGQSGFPGSQSGQVDPNAPVNPDAPADPGTSTITPPADGGQV